MGLALTPEESPTALPQQICHHPRIRVIVTLAAKWVTQP